MNPFRRPVFLSRLPSTSTVCRDPTARFAKSSRLARPRARRAAARCERRAASTLPGSDAAAVARAKSSNAEAAGFHKAYAEKLEAADVNEAAAQVTSIQLKQSLALESLGSITSMRSELVALLK